MNAIISISEASQILLMQVGGKGAWLGEVCRAGYIVPAGFVVTSTVNARCLKRSEMVNNLIHDLENSQYGSDEELKIRLDDLRNQIGEVEIEPDIIALIESAYLDLGCGRMAVRSSATGEDGYTSSQAGLLDSYLNVNRQNLMDSIRKCWASYYTLRGVVYRYEQGIAQANGMAVIVQAMLRPQITGVAFSSNFATTGQVIIEAGSRMQKPVVGGSNIPERYLINRDDLTQVKEGNGQLLDQSRVMEIARLAIALEKHFQCPCDLEWAIEKGRLYILQCRPITHSYRNTKWPIQQAK